MKMVVKEKIEVPSINQVTVEENIEILIQQFSRVEDPRREQGILHPLASVLGIYFCSLLAGRDGWDEAEDFGIMRKEWFSKFFDLPNGIPSNHTYSRVIQRISPKMLQSVFKEWLQAIKLRNEGIDTYNIDGKTLCGSREQSTNQKATHIVNVWAGEQNLIIAQEKVQDGTNEITAMKSVLKNIDLEGITVTADAIATQVEIASIVTQAGGNYIMCVKGNQSDLYTELQRFFAEEPTRNMSSATITEKGHGRLEKRCYTSSDNVKEIFGSEKWSCLTSVIKVDSSRTILATSKTSSETRFFISSHKSDVTLFTKKIRGHWQIENGLHWLLDVAMGEDDCRIRKGYAPENVAWMRAVALELLKKDPIKISVRRKMVRVGDSIDYLEKILLQ